MTPSMPSFRVEQPIRAPMFPSGRKHNLAVHIRLGLFSELAVFDARLDIRIRRMDEPA
jgi:hypothetical protein